MSLLMGIDNSKSALEIMATQKDNAYKERDLLVSLLSKVFPAWLERHPDSDKDWEDDWRWIVFIQLPTGQASWHIHDSELPWFDHLRRELGFKPSWDGHSNEEKYQRVLLVDTKFPKSN